MGIIKARSETRFVPENQGYMTSVSILRMWILYYGWSWISESLGNTKHN